LDNNKRVLISNEEKNLLLLRIIVNQFFGQKEKIENEKFLDNKVKIFYNDLLLKDNKIA